MRFLSCIFVFCLLFSFSSYAFAEEIKQGDKVTIVEPGTVARLCPYPNCGQDQHITRIPEGTVLTIEGITDIKSGKLPAVKWFEVTYKNQRGWLSIYYTNKVP